MGKHKKVPILIVKRRIAADFADWCEKRRTTQTDENMIEFLLQQGFLKGKKFREYVDGIEYSPMSYFEMKRRETLREGFYPPGTRI